ncbi:MAG TPA: PASTA domain-containing protein [Gemmatimonadales bacterium]|nr:PASTA domain-containing protein [Gemmatimonadales bacterium]
MRFRRHTAPPLLSTVGGRRLARQLAVIVAAGLLGFAATLWLNPGPLLSSDSAVPRVLDLPRADAERRLAEAGFRVRLESAEPSPSTPRDAVVWQDPPPGVVLPDGGVVRIAPSAGPPPLLVPDLAGLDEADARKVVGAAGLVVGGVDSVPATAPRGVVLSSTPAAGAPIAPRGELVLTVSGGPAEAAVPDVLGLALPEARLRLARAGFRLGTVSREVADQPDGIVLDQQPVPGTVSPQETPVNLVVSQRAIP